jgi:glucokinase
MRVRLGIDLGGSFIKAGIVGDHTFKILHQLTIPSEANIDRSAVKENLRKVYQNLCLTCRRQGHEILSLGIGSPGTIRQPDGRVTDASPNIKNWRGTVLTGIFGSVNFPVFADNDANCAALAEYLVGYKCRYKDMVFITVGTGIGGGLIIDGKLHRGQTCAAAEIGHTIIKHNGKLCKCGKHGCLEAYASVPNMMRRFAYWAKKAGDDLDSKITPKDLYLLFIKGKQSAVNTIKENADYLGSSLGSLANLLNPEVIVIGGGFADSGKEYLDLIRGLIKEHAFRAASGGLKVLGAKLGNKAGFIGASQLALVDKNGRIETR